MNTVAPPLVTVRYWAAVRAAAGTSGEQVRARTLAEALASIKASRHDPAFTRLIDHCAILHGELPVGRVDPEQVKLAEGDVIEFLPPFAGG